MRIHWLLRRYLLHHQASKFHRDLLIFHKFHLLSYLTYLLLNNFHIVPYKDNHLNSAISSNRVELKQDTSPVILFYSFSSSPVFSLFLKSTNPKTAQVAIPSPSKTSTPANAQGHQGVEDPLAISLMTPSSGFAFLY